MTLERDSMKTTIENLYKKSIELYTGSIDLETYKADLYREEIIALMDDEPFVYDLMKINLNTVTNSYKYELEKVLIRYRSLVGFLAYAIKNYSQQIINSEDYLMVKKIIFEINELQFLDVSNPFLEEFYLIDYEEEYVNINKESRQKEVIEIAKDTAREYLNEFDKYKRKKILKGYLFLKIV